MGEVCSSSRGQQPVWFTLRVAVAVLSSSLILDGRGALGRATTAAVGSDSPGSPGSASLRNATAVLLKPRGSSDIHKVSARWSALNAMPWSADVDHLVFIELKRVDPARIGLIQKAMGGRATIVDVSDEFEPAVARRSGDVDCPSNPTSNYFSFGYKVWGVGPRSHCCLHRLRTPAHTRPSTYWYPQSLTSALSLPPPPAHII
jgi:hypothetical protein